MNIFIQNAVTYLGIRYESGLYSGNKALPEQIAYGLVNAGYASSTEKNKVAEVVKLTFDSTRKSDNLIGASGAEIIRGNYRLPKLHAAMLSGKGARIAILGDSTTVGAGSGSGSAFLNGAAAKSVTAQLAKLFTDNGYFATDSYIGGNHLLNGAPGGAVSYNTYDPRLVLSGSAAPILNGEQNTFGGLLLTMNDAAGTMAFTPVEAIDSATVYFATNSSHKFTIGFTPSGGSRSVILTQQQSPGVPGIQKRTVTFPRSTGTLDINWETLAPASTSVPRTLGLEVWDSTAGAIRILNGGQYGDRLEAGTGPANNQNAWRGGEVIRLMQADAVIVDMSINSAVTGIGQLPAYREALTKICNDVVGSGADLILAVSHAIGAAAETTGVMAQFRQAIKDEAALRGCPVIDTFNALKDYPIMNARGQMADDRHPSESGYAVKARSYFDVLRLR